MGSPCLDKAVLVHNARYQKSVPSERLPIPNPTTIGLSWEEDTVQRSMMPNLMPIPHVLHMKEIISTSRRTNNSIAFGSAPRREADSQPISQLVRPADIQTVIRASRQADRNTQFGFSFSGRLSSKQWGGPLLHNKQRSNGNAAGHGPLGRRFKSRSADLADAPQTTAGRPGFQPPTCNSAVGCITIRPLFILRHIVLPTA